MPSRTLPSGLIYIDRATLDRRGAKSAVCGEPSEGLENQRRKPARTNGPENVMTADNVDTSIASDSASLTSYKRAQIPPKMLFTYGRNIS